MIMEMTKSSSSKMPAGESLTLRFEGLLRKFGERKRSNERRIRVNAAHCSPFDGTRNKRASQPGLRPGFRVSAYVRDSAIVRIWICMIRDAGDCVQAKRTAWA